jgi:branched-chain amino acid aminotransferase
LYYYINNQFIPADQAAVSVKDLALQRGYGVFDFFKTINGEAQFLDEHLNRFFNSAQHLRLPVAYSKEALKAIIAELMQQNNMADSGIRITLTGGASESGYAIATPNLIITQQAMQFNHQLAGKGFRLITYQHQRQLPFAKTTDYIMGIWLQPLIQQQHADEILYHQNGWITETPRANFFIVTKDQKIITTKNNILQGITRNRIINIAQNEFEVEERDIHLNELPDAAESFITSTTKQLMPVSQIDEIMIGKGTTGEISKWLFNQLVFHVKI